jgi:hypothetical protein
MTASSNSKPAQPFGDELQSIVNTRTCCHLEVLLCNVT